MNITTNRKVTGLGLNIGSNGRSWRPSTPPAYSTKELLAIRIPPVSSHTHMEVRGNSVIYSRPNHRRYVGPFREYIESMKTSWRSALAIQRRGYDVRTEADVVICAGWQAVLIHRPDI